MFGTIRRHQTWLWVVIITIIILSFVVFFSPDVKFGRSAPTAGGEWGSINGTPIKFEEFRPAYIEARINHFFRNQGNWPSSGDNLDDNLKRDAIYRVLLTRKLKELNIDVSENAIANLARERLGEQVMNNMRAFEKEYLAQGGVTLQELALYLKHEAGIQQMLQASTAGAKLVLPKEAETIYRQQHEQLATRAVLFSGSNYLANVTVTPEAVTNYYARQQAQYRVPERIQVAYVQFAASNFLADADKAMAQRTNLNAIIDEMYLKQGADAFKSPGGTNLSEVEAKAQIKSQARQEFALTEARRKAIEFGTTLYNVNVTNMAQFKAVAASNQLEVKISEPFDRLKGLENTDFPPTFRQRAMALTAEQPVSFSPVIGSNAVYVIALNNKVPSELPAFEKIKDKVTADYKYSQALETARREGNNFYTTLTNGLAQKKSFADIAAAAKIKTIEIPPFSEASGPTNVDSRINPRMLQSIAQTLKPGEASSFIPTMDGGMILFLEKRIPVPNEQVQKELPVFVGRMRFYRQNAAFDQWFRREAEKAKLVIPEKEQLQAPKNAPAPGKAPAPAPAPAKAPAPAPAPAKAPAPAPAK